jgi:hypothetical protein
LRLTVILHVVHFLTSSAAATVLIVFTVLPRHELGMM